MSTVHHRSWPFWLFQMVLLSAGTAWGGYRYHDSLDQRALPIPRNQPLRVEPLYDDPRVISDEQLAEVLTRVKPRFRIEKPKINYVDHALRLWGIDAHFDDPDCLSGEEMREMLLNHQQFVHYWGEETPPLLIETPQGVRIRTREGKATASHVDHTLAGLAEIGTPLDYPVVTPHRQTQLRAVLMQSLKDFSLNQREYEWSALAYALYLPPVKRWYSTEGQEITFDRLADRIIREHLSEGVCRGNHRLHSLVMLLRVDEQVPILSAEGRQRIIEHLQMVTQRFVETQQPDGYWEGDWPSGKAAADAAPADHSASPLDDPQHLRILVTGHVMEWWALAPPEVQPPREVVIKAAQWLVRTIHDLSEEQVESYYTFLTHAARALALWRSRQPSDVVH